MTHHKRGDVIMNKVLTIILTGIFVLGGCSANEAHEQKKLEVENNIEQANDEDRNAEESNLDENSNSNSNSNSNATKNEDGNNENENEKKNSGESIQDEQTKINQLEFPSIESTFVKDQSHADKELRLFVEDLWQAVINKDHKYLLGVTAEDVSFSFGGEYGKEAFSQTWKLGNDPGSSSIWRELKDTLELGGTFPKSGSEEMYFSPYLFIHFPEEYDPFQYSIIVHDQAEVYDQPGGVVIERLSIDTIVETSPTPPT
jgi:hypothetical protein